MKTVKSLKGERFGRLISLGECERRKQKVYEKCLCDCGNVIWTQRCGLFSGRTKSCGCLFEQMRKGGKFGRKHGKSRSRLYRIFMSAKDRCLNINNCSYKYYGGRGIRFLWERFEDFYNDMHESYEAHVLKHGEKETTIDRIDVNGDYCKDNCRWATYKEQLENRNIMFWKTKYNNLVDYLKSHGIYIPQDKLI